MLTLFAKGGFLMGPILFCSLTGWFIYFQRLLVFRAARGKNTGGHHRLLRLLAEGKVSEARTLVCQGQNPKSRGLPAPERLLLTVLDHEIRDRETLEAVLSNGVEREMARLASSLNTLALMGNIAPMLGLLGTVTGMIRAFAIIEERGGRVNAAVLAGGIWEAMLTTAFGLIVAIPLIIFHNHLLGRLRDLRNGLEEVAVAVLRAWPALKNRG